MDEPQHDRAHREPAPIDPVDDAWEASSLNRFVAPRFAARIESYQADNDPIGSMAGAGPQLRLDPVEDDLQRLLALRRSTKSFGTEPLGAEVANRILAAIGPKKPDDPSQGRLIPSPGALTTVTAYAVAANVEGPLQQKVVRYDHDRHEVGLVGPAPTPDVLRTLFSLDCEGSPQLLLVWVIDHRRARARYGARALRLVLQEVGHAAQNVALRIGHEGLVGYPLGGVLDAEVLDLLELRGLGLWVAGGFACGVGPSVR